MLNAERFPCTKCASVFVKKFTKHDLSDDSPKPRFSRTTNLFQTGWEKRNRIYHLWMQREIKWEQVDVFGKDGLDSNVQFIAIYKLRDID